MNNLSDSPNIVVNQCPLCGHKAALKVNNLPSYHQKTVYSVFHCSYCNTAYVLPRIPDNNLYEKIYKHAREIGGYNRYVDYADNILKQKEPLSYLAREDVYWSVEAVLKKIAVKGQTNILDFGSGLGYLTYAIHQQGYRVTGLDISQNAVTLARQKYGDYFVCADLNEYAKAHCALYDVVILAEVIEHLPDIATFLEILVLLLKADGKLIITTPNRSVYTNEVVWDTDLPPVHFWWLSENSLRVIAQNLGFEVEFVDFTPYNEKHNTGIVTLNSEVICPKPVFAINGDLIANTKLTRQLAVREMIQQLGILNFVRFIRSQARRARLSFSTNQPDTQRSYRLCAILTPRLG